MSSGQFIEAVPFNWLSFKVLQIVEIKGNAEWISLLMKIITKWKQLFNNWFVRMYEQKVHYHSV